MHFFCILLEADFRRADGWSGLSWTMQIIHDRMNLIYYKIKGIEKYIRNIKRGRHREKEADWYVQIYTGLSDWCGGD